MIEKFKIQQEKLNNNYLEIWFVCGFVEFIEKEEEHNGMHADPPDKCTWIIAIDEKQLECMSHNEHELDLWEKKHTHVYG